jgi:hypothetical protein
MTEQFCPHPENPKQHAPEAGAGSLGLPPPNPERERPRAELTPDQKQNSPQAGEGACGFPDLQSKHAKPQEKSERDNAGRAVFDCVLPGIRFDPLHIIRRRLRDGNLTEEEAQKLEQGWRESLKSMDRQTLEATLTRSEKRWEDYKESQKEKALTVHGLANLPVIEEEVKVIREELSQRITARNRAK